MRTLENIFQKGKRPFSLVLGFLEKHNVITQECQECTTFSNYETSRQGASSDKDNSTLLSVLKLVLILPSPNTTSERINKTTPMLNPTNLFLPKRRTGLARPIRHHFAPHSRCPVAKRSVCRSA
jgi:hypothetical protein